MMPMKSDSDAAPEVLDDPRAAAKARKRRRARSRVVRLLIAGLTGTVLLGLTALLKISHADYSAARGEVESRETQLRTLQAQQRSGHIRLAALQHEKGRAQSLIEHGYVRPGDRILLFPATPPPTTPQPTQNGPTKNSAAGETGEAATMGEETAVDTSAVGASASASASSASNSAAPGQALTGGAGSDVTSRAAAGLARSSAALRASHGSDSTRAVSSNAVPSPESASGSPSSKSSPPLKPPSAWRRAGQTLQGWWQAIRGAGAAPTQSQN